MINKENERFSNLINDLSIDGKLIHVGLLLQRAANLWPDNLMVICNDNNITYKELYNRSINLAKKLQTLGVKKNDRIIIFYENSIEFYIAYFASWHAGAIVAPLNVFLQEAELHRIIDDAKPHVIVISPTLFEKFQTYKSYKLPQVITTTDIEQTLEIVEDFVIPQRDINETAALLYTSGTTGFPKGVMLTSKNIITNAIQGIARFDTQPGERIYCALPLFHSLPQNVCVWANTVLGTTAIIVPKIDRKNLLAGIEKKPDFIIAVPALYNLFCLMKTVEFGPVKYFASGGDALTDKTRAYFGLLYRRKICNGYGLTETSPFISVDIDDYTQPTSCVGRPFIGIECAIRDENGNNLIQGDIGTLWIKGDNVMAGYYNSKEATDAILKDGWLNTGDLAYINENQKIVLAGRSKDLIINKGIKIYPQEIENLLLSHSQILQAAVIGIKQENEEIPVAFVAAKVNESEFTNLIVELEALCKRNLAFYKVPRRFIIKRELPITATGKVDKKKLKAEIA